MASPFAHLLRRMDALTVARMAKPVAINGQHYPAVASSFLPEMGPVSGNGLALVVFDQDYTPTHEDVVIWEGERYQIGRWHVLRRTGRARYPIEVVKIPLVTPLTEAYQSETQYLLETEMGKEMGYALKNQLRLYLTRRR